MLRIKNWTKLLTVLSLMCSVFSFNAMAQKPMNANALAALITEFKEVISKNARNQNDAKLIGSRWNKRKDLAGKNKSDVIELLYEDVKFVIKDSGVQYQIYSIFSFYKQIPDDFQSKKSTSAKAEAVKMLVELTLSAHPSVGVLDEQLALLPQNEESKKEAAAMKQNQIELFNSVLNENKKLTSAQKAFVKANYDRLGKIVDKQIADIIKSNFKFEQWIGESLEQNYTNNFTIEELSDLITFFQSADGRTALKLIKNSSESPLIAEKGGKPLHTKEEQSSFDKFIVSPLGEKFIAALLKEPQVYIDTKMKTASAKHQEETFAMLDTANLNKMFNKFVAENYKK